MNLEPSLDDEDDAPGCGTWFVPLVDGGRGIVSTLVEADKSLGDEIRLGLIFFLVDPAGASTSLGFEGDLRKAAVAACARR